jgi:alpha-L-rhamnosidase
MLKVFDLRTEYRKDPIGIDSPSPRFSWKLLSDGQNVMQKAYRILAAGDRDFQNIYWDSGRVESERSQRILYSGVRLTSCADVWWKVQVWAGEEEAVSDNAYFQMGLLSPDDWKAKWIEAEDEKFYDSYPPAPYLRKVFNVRKGLKRARIYQSAKGLYEFWMNGRRGTEDLFKPGLTSYYSRIQYQVYEITDLIDEGDNVWSVALGDGWWRGNGTRNNYGYHVGYIGQLLLEYDDGSSELVITDDSFRASTGGILRADMKDGELYDARIEPNDWRLVGFDDSGWKNTRVLTDGVVNLIASRSVPVRGIEQFEGKVIDVPNGELVIDFGQNIAGFVKMKLRGCKAGQSITVTHGEALDRDGNFTMDNIAGPGFTTEYFQQLTYIAEGPDEVSYSPLFSVFGFRYIRVEGYDRELINPGDFIAIAVYSALEETGDFTCSSPLINQLVKNSRWSQKGNFLDVPTDCPTRERGPYTGDSQVYIKTSSLFMNVYPFFEKWMLDYIPEQFPSGKIACIVPNVFIINNPEEYKRVDALLGDNRQTFSHSMPKEAPDGEGCLMDSSAGWGDAAVINPYILYLCYGDRKILENQYESAKKWVDYMDTQAQVYNPLNADEPYYHSETDGECDGRYVWDTCFHWGEWVEADGGEKINGKPVMPFFGWEKGNAIVATAYYAYSSGLVAKMAEILGKTEDAEYYGKLSAKVKQVYAKHFINDNGVIRNGRQAPNVRALEFGLCTEEQRQKVADALAEMVRQQDYHLNTGFLSTPYILHVLTEHGYTDIAFKLLEQESAPSWLRNVVLGATTIPENWTGYEQIKSSFNHYAFGAVCDFLFSGVAGIRPVLESPGYKHFEIRPVVGGSLTEASATYESIYGTIRSSWSKGDGGITYNFTVPVNTTATVTLAAGKASLESVRVSFPDAKYESGRVSFVVGSGNYTVHIES